MTGSVDESTVDQKVPRLMRPRALDDVWNNRSFRKLRSHVGQLTVFFRKRSGEPMPALADAARSRDRSGAEHAFADQKHRMRGVHLSAPPGRSPRIGIANIACNMRRLLFWETAIGTSKRT